MRRHAEEVKEILEQHDFDDGTRKALVHYFDYATERYYRLRTALIVFAVIISLGCAFGIQQGRQALTQFKHEANIRRDQSCLQQERQYATAVQRVQNTYRYISALSPSEAKSTLNQFVIRSVPDTEAQAKLAEAPKYCNEKGIGAPEPPPKLPKHKDFSYLLVNKG